MKKTILLFSICLLISVMGYTQSIPSAKVPVAVREAFEKEFSKATSVVYEMDQRGYKVVFKEKEAAMSANFTSSGEWLETQTIMIESELPNEVLTSVANNYVGYVITDIKKIEGPNKVLNYEMNLKKGTVAEIVKFSPKGDILRETPVVR